jgi:hypothetical protein
MPIVGHCSKPSVEKAISDVKPHLLLVLADNSQANWLIVRLENNTSIGWSFLDWVPVMKGHFGPGGRGLR